MVTLALVLGEASAVIGVPVARLSALPSVLGQAVLIGVLEPADALIVYRVPVTIDLDGFLHVLVLTILKRDDLVVIEVVLIVVLAL